MNGSGFGTIEAIVAVALLSVSAAALSSTVIVARRLQTAVAAERVATRLAVARLERLRSGERPEAPTTVQGYAVSETLQAGDANPRLLEARVRVAWQQATPRSIELRTLIVR